MGRLLTKHGAGMSHDMIIDKLTRSSYTFGNHPPCRFDDRAKGCRKAVHFFVHLEDGCE